MSSQQPPPESQGRGGPSRAESAGGGGSHPSPHTSRRSGLMVAGGRGSRLPGHLPVSVPVSGSHPPRGRVTRERWQGPAQWCLHSAPQGPPHLARWPRDWMPMGQEGRVAWAHILPPSPMAMAVGPGGWRPSVLPRNGTKAWLRVTGSCTLSPRRGEDGLKLMFPWGRGAPSSWGARSGGSGRGLRPWRGAWPEEQGLC